MALTKKTKKQTPDKKKRAYFYPFRKKWSRLPAVTKRSCKYKVSALICLVLTLTILIYKQSKNLRNEKFSFQK